LKQIYVSACQTALFRYVGANSFFGVPDWIAPAIHPLVTHPVGVVALTWGTIALEMVLAAGLFMKERYRPWLLAAGLTFHDLIAIVHGLFTFFFSSATGLILYLRSYDQPFSLPIRLKPVGSALPSPPPNAERQTTSTSMNTKPV